MNSAPILVVEDSEGCVSLFKHALQRAGVTNPPQVEGLASSTGLSNEVRCLLTRMALTNGRKKGPSNVHTNRVELLVMFRTTDGRLITAPLEFDADRAFAVLPIYERKATNRVVSNDRIELEARYLEKMDRKRGAHLLYVNEVRLPDRN